MLTSALPASTTQPAAQRAAEVPAVTRTESAALATAEVTRFVALMEALGPEDWAKPTPCTAWSVRDILAHQAGAYAGGASLREFLHQNGRPPKAGELAEDVANRIQLADRAGRGPAELLAELKAVWPQAVARRKQLAPVVGLITLPRPDGPGLNLGHLFTVIYARDTWMHRLDISRATGRAMQLTPEHDGRMVALVLRDLAANLGPKLGDAAVRFELSGTAGGAWVVGGSAAPSATVQMETLDFNIYASGRFSYAEARAKATLSGDTALAERALRATAVLY